MRFDDSLKTVLAADTSTAFGARAAYRQLIDLVARRRVDLDEALLARLETLRRDVPVDMRAALGRGLALADPPVALIAFLAGDVPEAAATVLRAARLAPEDWDWLLPRLGPHGRSVLRRRSDLPPTVVRALEAFGSTDFALSHEVTGLAAPASAAPDESTDDLRTVYDLAAALPLMPDAQDAAPAAGERFEIAELVDRIAAFQRDRAAAPPRIAASVAAFRFETDAAGVIRWIDSAPRGAVIGLSLDHAGTATPRVDGIAAGAFRKRAPFGDARLAVPGNSPLGGDWRMSAMPLFDPLRGHFIGYRGSARRPRAEEDAARLAPRAGPASVEGLRRLVHELRTPTTAISGFAELIDEQMLGPVAPIYRDRAATIRRQVGGLIGAIDDLDTAARLEADALDLREETVEVAALLHRIARDMMPLAMRRGATVAVEAAPGAAWAADAPALDRLIARLVASLLSTAAAGETLALRATAGDPAGMIRLAIDRPRALDGRGEADLLTIDDERAGDVEGAPLLGIGFSLRLARHLAIGLGGGLSFERARLTLTLPAASTTPMGQASTSVP